MINRISSFVARNALKPRSLAWLAVLASAMLLAPDRAQAQLPTFKAIPAKLKTVELIADSVANLTTTDLLTVPADRRVIITDLLIANSNNAEVVSQRVFRGASAATLSLVIPANSSFSHVFATGIEFDAGEVVRVRNGASSGPVNFYLRGYIVKVPSTTP